MQLALEDRDKRVIWHPFTQMLKRPFLPCLVKGEGAYVYDTEGAAYLDACSSWWTNLHGHCHPRIVEAMQRQCGKLSHASFGDATHVPAIALAERIISLLPAGFEKVFYSNSGSEAVETALKMAVQFFYNRGEARKAIVCLTGSYHGDTFGAMSASARTQFNAPFKPLLFHAECIQAPLPGQEKLAIQQLKHVLEKEQAAGFIFEPIIQGASGMLMMNPAALDELLGLCHEKGVVSIADEVMTGFGRTGKIFAIEHLKEVPDIICLAKGLTGGALPLSITACRLEIFNAFLSEKREHALLHGHTYAANPIACAAALASLDLLQTQDCQQKIAAICRGQADFVKKWRGHPAFNRCESFGTILALEYRTGNSYDYESPLRDSLHGYFLRHGVLMRPLGNTLVLVPPYCISTEDLARIHNLIEKSLEEVS